MMRNMAGMMKKVQEMQSRMEACLLYTSDAADE